MRLRGNNKQKKIILLQVDEDTLSGELMLDTDFRYANFEVQICSLQI